MTGPEVFDRQARALRRDRAARGQGEDILRQAIAEDLIDRLAGVQRTFTDVLDLGCGDGSLGRALEAPGRRVTYADAGAVFASRAGGVQAEEDRLPFDPGSFDLIVSANVLDQVNDLPGALIQARRLLRPDGLFLAGFCAGGSAPRLREAFLAADMAEGRAVARIHPQIPLQAGADLLGRAGFAMPVADGFTLNLRYGSLFRLVEDLRAMAATNLLPGRQALSRRPLMAAVEAFVAQADPDGRVTERFEIAVLTGWAPAESQPKPARRGSATVSLAEALKAKP
ncbi:class I SAM-dependent DNA methyltransferase [Sphingomonas sp. ID0503]|uniref:class I SAM-dependent DNA methyltransferase n=1 Tax=Sphingomonas sp. ID0503 TaxID=3399691 RepID=UPI003AFA7237